MIEEISIRNLGVIGEAVLPLGPGFTAVTGETGAGKTMVVTALGLLLGARSDSSVLRHGSGSAVVEGRWRIDPAGAVADRVREAGGDVEEGDLILGRSISADGRSRAVVGGRSAPVGVLGELGERLVVVHGQSDQVRLRSATAQREALDRFAGAPLASLLAQYSQSYRRWQHNQGELDVLIAEGDRRAREAEELRLAMAEIEEAAPRDGEDVELAERAEKLSNLEDLAGAAAQAHELISSDTDDSPYALGLLESARRQLERVAPHDAALTPIVELIESASILISEVSVALSAYLAGLDTDGAGELEIVQERRAVLNALVRKYGPTLEQTIAYLDLGSSRLLELDNDTDRIAGLERDVEADRAAVVELAAQLTVLRTSSSLKLAEQVSAELTALAMPDARLSVDIAERPDYGISGKDEVTLLLAPHPGAEPRSLSRGASGGELSRVMLAIEVVIAASDPVPTFIFDEIDAGVGGASAIEIGRRLARLAESAQVVVVTHLAQVAAFATNHLRVVKDNDGEVTASSVQQLVGDARIEEMARLLSGLPDSESGLVHARELIEIAQELAHDGGAAPKTRARGTAKTP